jgi:hypothetical protein
MITSGSPRLLIDQAESSIAQSDRVGKAQIGIEIKTLHEFDQLHALVP